MNTNLSNRSLLKIFMFGNLLVFNFLINNSRWLAAGALLTLMSGFGQTFFISIFAGEIRSTFNLSHGDWGLSMDLELLLQQLLWFGRAGLQT